jgi:hypothetical protein
MNRFGRKVYVKNPIKEKVIGTYICPVCGQESILTERKGYGFKNILCVCDEGHTCEISIERYAKYRVGDTIRVYESTFGKDSVIRKDCYTEGIVVKSYPSILDYCLDFKPTKIVFYDEILPKTAGGYAEIHTGVEHHRRDVELVKQYNDGQYEQMCLKL